jgi:predicted phosphodiesterase
MNEPVRLFSDLHLAHPVSRIRQVAALRPLLAGAGTVIFNGDTWQELTRSVRERSAAMVAELQALCADVGCTPVFLSGNHDPGWAGPGWIELAGGRIVVTHGDALLPDGSPWKREILVNGARVLELWREHPAAGTEVTERLQLARDIARALPSPEPVGGKWLWQRAWDAVTPPRRGLHILEAWWNQSALAAEFCRQYFPAAEVLVIGHFHWSGCWLRDGRRIINTGSFVNPGRAHWVEWHAGWLRRGVIQETPDTCHLGEILEVWKM